jgi:nucleotide-binding universal stress UspA family protein
MKMGGRVRLAFNGREFMFKQVLVATDGSSTSTRGLKAAIGLASDQRAALTVLHVIDNVASVAYVGDMGYIPADYVDTLLADLRGNGRKILAKAEALARDNGVTAKTVMVESKGQAISDVIVREARKARADVIVLGTHGRRGLRRVLMGSDAEAVLRESRIPVLLVRGSERATATRSKAAAASTRTSVAARERARAGLAAVTDRSAD